MKSYYLFNPGRMNRQDNSLQFVAYDEVGKEQKPRYLPIEDVENLYAFGALDINSALLNFLGQRGVHIHFFDYYEYYTGSFAPREYLLAGKMQVEQTRTYINTDRRIYLASRFIEGGSWNMLHNLKYYNRRGRDMDSIIKSIDLLRSQLDNVVDIPMLMGVEGNIRQYYYQAFDFIIDGWEMVQRSKQPPQNEVNALISFGNMMCYTLAMQAIYHTQLNPTISFLHEPQARRYSLALDLAEIFKPVLVDRIIFKMLNKKELSAKDFDKNLAGCYLKESGKRTFIKNWEERLSETIQHPTLGRKVSYKHLVRLECYKLTKYILQMEDSYKPFKMY